MRRIVALIAVLGFANSSPASGPARVSLTTFDQDQLGERVRTFPSIDTGASCTRQLVDGFIEKDSRVHPSARMDCSLEKGVTHEGEAFLVDLDPTRPFGVLPSFCGNRLVELTYTSAVKSIKAVLPRLENCYGTADQITHNSAGVMDSVRWVEHGIHLRAELAVASPAVAEKSFLRLGKGAFATAVRIRLRALFEMEGSQRETRNDSLAPAPRSEHTDLPESPQPKSTTQDGVAKSNGKFTYPADYDPLHLNDGTKSWGRAMVQPSVLIPSAVLVGLTTIQLVKTDRCISGDKPACNLVFGKNRTAAYAFNIPATAGLIWFAAHEKQNGHGLTGFVTTAVALILETPVAFTGNPHVLVCRSGRTPECQ